MRNFYYYIPIFLQKVGYIVFYTLHKLFVKIEIRGRENLHGVNGPIIIAANHTSELDVTAIHLVLPFFSKFYPLYYVNNPEEKYNTFGWRSYIYGGVFFNMLGGYAVHSGFRDYGISLEDHLHLLEKGRTIMIFPEGKRTPDGIMSRARGGLGYMVHKTDATVIPAAINTFYNMNSLEYFGRRRRVVITILPPMTVSDLITSEHPNVDDFKAAGQIVLDRIKEVL